MKLCKPIDATEWVRVIRVINGGKLIDHEPVKCSYLGLNYTAKRSHSKICKIKDD